MSSPDGAVEISVSTTRIDTAWLNTDRTGGTERGVVCARVSSSSLTVARTGIDDNRSLNIPWTFLGQS